MKKMTRSLIVANARRIRDNIDLFNTATSNTIKMGTLQNIFELTNLEGVIIYGLANYKPHRAFQGEKDSNCWYARIAIDIKNDCAPFIAIEKRRGGNWELQKLIPLKRIASIKTDTMGENETCFHLYITVEDLVSIETPSFINF